MEAIKKKMLAMKLDKENAIDLADQLEEQLKEKETEMSKKEEEMGDVVKRYQSLEAEKEAAETQLAETNQKLEDTEKRAQERRRWSTVSASGRWKRGEYRRNNQILPPHYQPNKKSQIVAESPAMRMTSSYIDFSTSHSFYPRDKTASLPRQVQRKRRSRQRRGSRRPVCECGCTCQQFPQPMFNSMYEFSHLGARPDPEGCASTAAFPEEVVLPVRKSYVPFSMDEPLFSDYGGKSDDEDEYVRARKKQSIRDYKSAFAEAYSASRLNSGTLIQLAIVEAELKNLVHSSLDKAEAEVAALQRRIRLLEDDLESTDTRLTDATAKLEEASKAADESERGCKVLENRTVADEERIASLEEQLKEFTFMAEDADRKYDESSRKLAMSEVDLERAESRLEAAERKILDLEDELRIVGNNMKSLEISEQEAAQREEAYEENIRDLTERLKAAEDRAQDAERLVHTLQGDADRLEDELVAEKERYKALAEELEQTFAELTGN
uniref:Tropomyosin 2 high molecular weight isoform n=1 Tax=Mesocestoides corti TaxID=53468 RepID=A0A5K3EUM6_MESCO